MQLRTNNFVFDFHHESIVMIIVAVVRIIYTYIWGVSDGEPKTTNK